MNWRVLMIEKHPPVCRESFWGHPLGTITTDGPLTFGPNFKIHPERKDHLKPIFLLKTNVQTFVARVDCKDVRYKTY
jgi:hypothetical protein